MCSLNAQSTRHACSAHHCRRQHPLPARAKQPFGCFFHGGEGGIRPPPGGPGRGSAVLPVRHLLPLPSNPSIWDEPKERPVLADGSFLWLKIAILSKSRLSLDFVTSPIAILSHILLKHIAQQKLCKYNGYILSILVVMLRG